MFKTLFIPILSRGRQLINRPMFEQSNISELWAKLHRCNDEDTNPALKKLAAVEPKS